MTLGIDTATTFLTLALVGPDGGVLAETSTEVWRDHAARIMPELAALFKAAGVASSAVGTVCVGTGPGSYTGLRIGIATAKGLAHGWGIPAFGGDTLAALAASGAGPGETVVAALDARRGNIYFGVYRLGATGPTPLVSAGKAARETVRAAYPGLRMIEGLPPSAVCHAHAAGRKDPVRPVYL